MAAIMPQELQAWIQGDQMSGSVGDNVIRSEMDVGPPKRRRRFSGRVDTLPIRLNLTLDLFRKFEYFYTYTLRDGSLSFHMTHPIEGVTRKFAFTSDTYQFRNIGVRHYQVTATLQVLP